MSIAKFKEIQSICKPNFTVMKINIQENINYFTLVTIFISLIFIVAFSCDPLPAQISSINSNLNMVNDSFDTTSEPITITFNETNYLSYPDYKTTYIPATILLGTFHIVQSMNYPYTQQERNIVAITGMLTTTITYFLFQYINEHKKHGKNYKTNRPYP